MVHWIRRCNDWSCELTFLYTTYTLFYSLLPSSRRYSMSSSSTLARRALVPCLFAAALKIIAQHSSNDKNGQSHQRMNYLMGISYYSPLWCINATAVCCTAMDGLKLVNCHVALGKHMQIDVGRSSEGKRKYCTIKRRWQYHTMRWIYIFNRPEDAASTVHEVYASKSASRGSRAARRIDHLILLLFESPVITHYHRTNRLQQKL